MENESGRTCKCASDLHTESISSSDCFCHLKPGEKNGKIKLHVVCRAPKSTKIFPGLFYKHCSLGAFFFVFVALPNDTFTLDVVFRGIIKG